MCPHLNDRSTAFTNFKRTSQRHPDELMGAWHILENRPLGRVRRNRVFHNTTEEDNQQYQEEQQERIAFEELAGIMVNYLLKFRICRFL